MNILDISVPLADRMIRYPSPYLPDVRLVPAATHEKEARSAQVLTCGTHVSTHIDAPFHAIPDGKTIEQIPLRWLIGPAQIVRFNKRDRHSPLRAEDFDKLENLKECERLVIDTGWATRMWGTPEYFTDGPYLTHEGAIFLSKLPKLHLLGMDFTNVDSREETIMGKQAPNHQELLKKDVILLENLLHLERVDEKFLLSALPPRLEGGDACPCRAIAIFPLHELLDWIKG